MTIKLNERKITGIGIGFALFYDREKKLNDLYPHIMTEINILFLCWGIQIEVRTDIERGVKQNAT